ncbi:MAG TPA: LPXTG cell wall anchor domain-containing protein [Flavisolibacter sp.]|nr:LPXTG cell wall anchor domain-containing protein [Flavisolibacter sp.]
MKKLLFFITALIFVIISKAQDTARIIEPRQTSEENYDLLLIAVIGLLMLIALYFLFRKTRKK